MPRHRLPAQLAQTTRLRTLLALPLCLATTAQPLGQGPLSWPRSADGAEARALAATASWSKGWESGQKELWVDANGISRRYVLFVPPGYKPAVAAPLWLAFPGTGDAPEGLISQSGMTDFAVRHSFVLAFFEGQDLSMNVEAHGLSLPERPDDVLYTEAVLRDVMQKIHVNRNRIHCVGFSRGARFCSRLASEMSSFISSIAAVSGIRFPKPNNATRPIPIIAFHGTKDPVNPFWGHGAAFWTESVPDAIHRWVHFNGCKKQNRQAINKEVALFKHAKCRDGADVFLVQVNGGGHTWPGSYKPTNLGFVSHDIAATVDIYNFFRDHPLWQECKTSSAGETCYTQVMWAMQRGIFSHPEWYKGLTPNSTFEDFQEVLHESIVGDCPKPCPVTTTVTSTTTSSSTSATTTITTSTTTSSTGTRTITTTTTTAWIVFQWIDQLQNIEQKRIVLRRPALPDAGARRHPAGGPALLGAAALLGVLAAALWKVQAARRAGASRQQLLQHSWRGVRTVEQEPGWTAARTCILPVE